MHVRALTAGLALAATVLLSAPPAQADTTKDFTTGGALILANVFYMPAKLVYAAAGSVVAGAAYAVSGGDADVVDPILAAAIAGDYVIEEKHLRGKEEIEFVGRLPAHEQARDVAAGGEDAGF